MMQPIVLLIHKNDPLYIWIDILNVPIQSYHFYCLYLYLNECVYIMELKKKIAKVN